MSRCCLIEGAWINRVSCGAGKTGRSVGCLVPFRAVVLRVPYKIAQKGGQR